jgi:hypothetical protein
VTTRAARARASEESRRYPVIGGAAIWALGLLAGLLALAAVFHRPTVAIAVAALWWGAHRVARTVVVEVSPVGLSRGLLDARLFQTRPVVVPWRSIVEIRTAWRRRGDDSALETVVRDCDGRAIRLSTAMGLTAYWECLAEVVRRAPAAARVGLTDRVLADGPPGRPDLVAAIQTAAALALILAVMVAMHYVWAQGASTVVRDLERTSAERESRPR